MSKPDSYPNPDAVPHNEKKRRDDDSGMPKPLSGSKKIKSKNHVSHLNPEG